MTAELGHERVREFLRDLYGKEPEPLRSYLTNQEAMNLMGQCVGARLVTVDLNLSGYGCKWRNAVEDQIRSGLDPMTWDFWQRARTAFLEYGGEYKDSHRPPQKQEA